mmetsp:Transcript_61025/g.157822  ORF Transcript_61025/g.157822 Transcript_61025/m.157822 type:complete len:195 (+) Transcript_61025:31-615(+)
MPLHQLALSSGPSLDFLREPWASRVSPWAAARLHSGTSQILGLRSAMVEGSKATGVFEQTRADLRWYGVLLAVEEKFSVCLLLCLFIVSVQDKQYAASFYTMIILCSEGLLTCVWRCTTFPNDLFSRAGARMVNSICWSGVLAMTLLFYTLETSIINAQVGPSSPMASEAPSASSPTCGQCCWAARDVGAMATS